MEKIGQGIARVVRKLGISDAARINMRAREVRDRYRQAIESVYPGNTAALHLAHTNKVIIKDVRSMGKNGNTVTTKTLIVYVDDSLFAAELNAQRELIKLRILELFGEEIESFDIRISGRKEYKSEHPYLDERAGNVQVAGGKPPKIKLEPDEESFVSETVSTIADKRLRKSLEKAMTADLEWKKGEKSKSNGENAK